MTGTKPGTNRHRRGGAGLMVQPRDRELLGQLFLMRMATRDQLMRAVGFGSITRANTRLLRLHRAGLLRRFFIGFGAARKAVYALSPKSAQMIGVPCRGPRRKQNALLAADSTVLHQLAINDVYCALRFPETPHREAQFVNWLTFTEPITEGLHLIPDGYMEFKTAQGIDASFLEVDLGSEELKVWKEKASRYVQLATSGEFSRQFKQSRFRVLVLADSARRLTFIRTAVSSVTEKIFWFATLEDMKGEKLFSPVWQRPVGELQQSLFEKPR
jgi:hypothetical protein